VIGFEGNAGFYEIGIVATPLDLGYSVLGYNHPGFAGSTGTPYPPAELNAAEAIFDYAVNELGFKEENIILFAWSIGGFPASHLAANHPKIKALILDATFDDIMPLALPRMPAILSGVVHSTIRNHANIRVNKELRKYAGPLRLIRRTEDEIIADPPAVLTENRGNHLLVDVIRTRFPGILGRDPLEPNAADKALNDWLAKPHIFDSSSLLTRQKSTVVIPENLEQLAEEDKSRLVIAIAEKLMSDFKSTHCTPLHPNLFEMPWTPPPSRNAEKAYKL
jgi:pimeloyl-ACP methyl ester carboxylesterase